MLYREGPSAIIVFSFKPHADDASVARHKRALAHAFRISNTPKLRSHSIWRGLSAAQPIFVYYRPKKGAAAGSPLGAGFL
jgi:hypothetical protein